MAGPRLKPSHLALAVGVGFAGLTAASGTAAAILHWDDEHPVHRPVFFNIPGPLEALFYVATVVSFVAVGWMFAQRFKGYERGTPDNRRTTPANARRRVADFRAGVYMQTLMRDGAAGLMHSLMYFPFLGLFA
ncbi:MAG: iron-sulfur protein, partial [Acidimicrobiales bacterium]